MITREEVNAPGPMRMVRIELPGKWNGCTGVIVGLSSEQERCQFGSDGAWVYNSDWPREVPEFPVTSLEFRLASLSWVDEEETPSEEGTPDQRIVGDDAVPRAPAPETTPSPSGYVLPVLRWTKFPLCTGLERAPVLSGWLLRVIDRDNWTTSVTFIPDPDGEWWDYAKAIA